MHNYCLRCSEPQQHVLTTLSMGINLLRLENELEHFSDVPEITDVLRHIALCDIIAALYNAGCYTTRSLW